MGSVMTKILPYNVKTLRINNISAPNVLILPTIEYISTMIKLLIIHILYGLVQ